MRASREYDRECQAITRISVPTWLIDIDAIEPFGVLEHNVLCNVGRHPGKVLFDYFERMRKLRIGMGKVGCPHIIMLAKELPGRRTKRVILESRPHVPPYILTRLHR